jgi:hypothetical protein
VLACVALVSLFIYGEPLKRFLFPLAPDALDALLASRGETARLVPPALSSPADEAQRNLFAEVLAMQHADILVVPLSAPTARSADRAARSLITRRLATAVAERTGLTVADPGLVQLALGVRRRSFEADRVDELARSMGVHFVVNGEIARDAGSEEFRLKLRVIGGSPPQEVSWNGLRASDANPIDEVFRGMLDEILVKLSLSLSVPSIKATLSRDALDATLPARPFDLIETAAAPLDNALRLQLFASLHPPEQLEASLLWERSLIALDHVAPDLPTARLLRARALFHLGRRPAAKALLDRVQGSAAKALWAVLQGNLTQAEALAAEITEPALQLIAALEARAIRDDYGLAGPSTLLADLRRKLPAYDLLLEARDSQSRLGTEHIARRIASELQAHAISANDGTRGLGSLWRGAFGDVRFDVARAVATSKAQQWYANASQWGAAGLSAALTPADYFALLYSLNRAAALATVQDDCADAERARNASRNIDILEQTFGLDAQVNLLHAACLATDHPTHAILPYTRELIRRLARDAYVWEGGESGPALRALDLIGDKRRVLYQDEPPHPARRWTVEGADAREHDWRRNLRRLQWVHTDFSVIEELEQQLREAGRYEEWEQLQEEIEGRFEGSPRRASLLARLARERGDLTQQENIFRAGIMANAADWNHYEQLARVLLLKRQAREAATVLQSFPGFASAEVGDPVRAQRAAHLLLDAGEPELAAPLLTRSANLQTQGATGVWGAEMQAFLRGDMRSAAAAAERQMREFGAESAAARAMDYAFLLGEETRAWQIYAEAATHPEWSVPRWAAVFGIWLKGGNERDLFEKALQQSAAGAAREHLVFMALFLDKLPSDDAIEMLRQVSAKRDGFSFLHVAAGIQAFRRRDYPALLRGWSALHERLSATSLRQDRSLNYALPYLALAHWSAGTLDGFKLGVEAYAKRFPRDFDTLLARAVVAAAEAHPDLSLDLLWQAFIENPGAAQRPIPTELMLLDVLEGVYEHTRNARYRTAILDFARRMQRSWPTSYYYSVEANYASSEQERLRALGVALYLDRNSAHLAQFSEEEKERARQWFIQNRGFPLCCSDGSPGTK